MKLLRKILLAALLAAGAPSPLFACAACGSSNSQIQSPLVDGMNLGILTLLGVLLTVLTCALVFFVHIIRKDEAAGKDSPPPTDV
ncbi:MAG: hypothetical protein WAO02_17125 [Verrucomicrobiia bacterium]